jgi:hypothetical protein
MYRLSDTIFLVKARQQMEASNPQAYDVVLGGQKQMAEPKSYDVVLGGQSQKKHDDFWGIMHLPDVLNKNTFLPNSLKDVTDAIEKWKSEGKQPEICYIGFGRVGTGYGEYALLGARKSDGGIDETKIYALTVFSKKTTAKFAERHQIVNFVNQENK